MEVLPAKLARGQGISLWRQIMTTLEREIAGDARGPGARLPTEADYSARFAVNRHTVRRALEELAGRGLIRIEQGRGSFIAEDLLEYPIGGQRVRFTESIRRQNREPTARLLRLEEVPAEAPIADALRLRRGQPVLLAERLASVDGRPMLLGAHHLPLARFPSLQAMLADDPSITRALTLLGFGDYRRQQTRVSARMPTLEEAELLEIARSRPVLVTESLNVDADGAPLEISIARYAAGRVQLLVES